MRYIKTYEDLTDTPQVGDYVIVDSSKMKDLHEFFDSEIGKIDSINQKESECKGWPYYVTFEKRIPSSSFGESDDMMAFKQQEFLAWSPNKEDLKIYMDTKKYNL